MRAALDEAVEQGLIEFPSRNGDCWDRTRSPALPSFVSRIRSQEEENNGRAEWRTFPWHPKLSWVLDLSFLSETELSLLKAVHARLVEGGFEEHVPLAVRSLELTGHEKRLRRMVGGRLFEEERLSPEDLACYRPALPLVWERVGDGGRWLVFENRAPFSLAYSVLVELSDQPFSCVAFGQGRYFPQTLPYVRELPESVDSMTYVGDLDVSGLETLRDGILRAEELTGIPAPQPAVDLYREMLEAAEQLGHPEGFPYQDRPPAEENIRRVLSELPRELSSRIASILLAGRRIPEEVLTPERLRARWGASG